MIWKKVANRRIPGEDVGQENAMNVNNQMRSKVGRICFVVIIIFIITRLPLFIIFWFVKFEQETFLNDQGETQLYIPLQLHNETN